jgi:triacylglycerol lipase
MYFPKGFDCHRAIELGELVNQAYNQFESYEKGEPWKLANGYTLIKELHYILAPDLKVVKGSRHFDALLQALGFSGIPRGKPLPIGFVAERNGEIFIIFRGTQHPKEWIRNLNMDVVPYLHPGFGNVHDGFIRSYVVVSKVIQESLVHLKQRMKLFIAGHSLGGALATLSVPDIAISTPFKTPTLYTFGSPRVGDKEFGTAYNQQFARRTFRIVNTSDIVPSIPLPVPLAGIFGGYFTHVDTPVDFTVQKDDLEENHSMETYLSALAESNVKKGFFPKLISRMRLIKI